MRRLEDCGTTRRAHRHMDILDVVEDDFGISIVSVLAWVTAELYSLLTHCCVFWYLQYLSSCVSQQLHHLRLRCSHWLLSFCSQDTIAIKKRSSRTRRIRPVSNRLSESHADHLWDETSTVIHSHSVLLNHVLIYSVPPAQLKPIHSFYEIFKLSLIYFINIILRSACFSKCAAVIIAVTLSVLTKPLAIKQQKMSCMRE